MQLSNFTPGRGGTTREPAALLTTAEAARMLGLSASCLNKWRHFGAPGAPVFIRVGDRTVRYERRTLEAWIAARESTR